MPFFNIPVEIRLEIYRNILSRWQGLTITEDTTTNQLIAIRNDSRDYEPEAGRNVLALLFTCSTIQRELVGLTPMYFVGCGALSRFAKIAHAYDEHTVIVNDSMMAVLPRPGDHFDNTAPSRVLDLSAEDCGLEGFL